MPGPGSHSPDQWSGGSTRRSGYSDIFHAVKDKEVQERALQLAESLMQHELAKRTEKFVFLTRANVMKFLLMLISSCSFLVLLHADFHSEFYAAFLVQLGTSTALFPSIFRASTMFLRLNMVSPLIEFLIVFIIFVHQSMAAITLLVTMLKTTHPNSKELLYFNAALLFAGVSISLSEIGAVIFSAQLQRQSLSWTISTREAEDNGQPVADLL